MVGGTTDAQLKAIVSAMHLKHTFLGVFDNSFPGFIDSKKSSSAIINTGSAASGGMHWIGFAYEPIKRICYMFDPFGWSDEKLWSIYKFKYDQLLKRTGLSQLDRCITLVKSNQSVQCTCSAACGLFCILFIASFDSYPNKPMIGNPIIDVVQGVNHSDMNKPMYRSILHSNQERLYQWLSRNNSYFRSHRTQLENETKLNTLPHFNV
nr:protease [Duck aviadenovirus]